MFPASDLIGRVLLETVGVINDEENSAFLLINAQGELLTLAIEDDEWEVYETEEVGNA